MIIIFYFTTIKIQPWDSQKHKASHPGIWNLFCKHFLTASQSLNINLPVIGGKNNRQLKKKKTLQSWLSPSSALPSLFISLPPRTGCKTMGPRAVWNSKPGLALKLQYGFNLYANASNKKADTVEIIGLPLLFLGDAQTLSLLFHLRPNYYWFLLPSPSPLAHSGYKLGHLRKATEYWE